MKQKIPKVPNSDIVRIIKRDFNENNTEKILTILKNYHSEESKGKNRIYDDILKLSNGSLELLNKYVEVGNYDYRDIISASEYPEYSKNALKEKISKKERK